MEPFFAEVRVSTPRPCPSLRQDTSRSRAACLVLAVLLSTTSCSRRRSLDPDRSTEGPSEVALGPQLAPVDGPTPLPAELASDQPESRLATRGNATADVEVVSAEGLLERALASSASAIIVNAWASWCGPCRREFPMLVSLAEHLKPHGVAIVFVSVDEPESYDAAAAFAREHGQTGPILVAERPLGKFKQRLNPNWPGMLPATFLFDERGALRFFWGGPVYEEELLPVVEGLLKGEEIDGEQRFGLRPGRDERR